MATESIPPPSRICNACKRELPATPEFFHKDSKGKFGLGQTCKACACARARAWAEQHYDRVLEAARAYSRTRTSASRKAESAARREKHPDYFKRYYKQHAEELRQYQRDRRAVDPEKNLAERRAEHERNRDAYRARSKAWAAANPEKVREMRAAYYLQHADKLKAKQRAYKAEHAEQVADRAHFGHLARKEHHNALARAWKAAHPEKVRAAAVNRQAMLKKAPGKITPEDVLAQYATQNGTCFYGPHSLAQDNYQLDHYIPLKKGGSNEPSNIVLACPACNGSKHDSWPWDFIARLTRRTALS
jgi:5-methylcytosine-specific restriction endonuclease McrA